MGSNVLAATKPVSPNWRAGPPKASQGAVVAVAD
jgi:hypothetical protein